MEIQFKGKSLELSFGFKALTILDKKLGMEVDQVSMGQGLQLLVPNLLQGSLIAIGETILATTAHHKKRLKKMTLTKFLKILQKIKVLKSLQKKSSRSWESDL